MTLDVADRRTYSNAYPLSVTWRSRRPVVQWGAFDDVAFTDPFFWDTYARATSSRSTVHSWETDGDVLMELAAASEPIRLSGLIFHIGRCGSTLVSQILSRSDRVLMMSEPDAMVGLLDFPQEVTQQDRLEWLRALVTVLGRPRRPTENRFVVKLTSYHVLGLNLFLEAMPELPWIFVIREPERVIRSILRKPTGLMLQREDPSSVAPLLGLRPAQVAMMDPEEFLARALVRMFDTVLAHEAALTSNRARIVDYSALPAAVWEDVAPLFDIATTEAERLSMQAASRLYSKDPTLHRLFKTEDHTDRGELLHLVEPDTREALMERYRRLKTYSGDPRSGTG